jgi:hypothetical protein
MKKYDNNQITMHETGVMFLGENEDKMLPFSMYPSYWTKLNDSYNLEMDLVNDQVIRMQMNTEGKTGARILLSDFTIDLCTKNKAYALSTGDKNMQSRVYLTRSKLNKCSDKKFVALVKNQLSFSQENLPALAEFKVTAATLADGDKLLGNFNDQVAILANNAIALKQVTEQLSIQVKITNKCFTPIDSLVDTYSLSDPVFHRSYLNARNVKHTATAKVAFKGKVYDAVTLQPLVGAKVTFALVEGSKALTSGADLVKTVKVKSAGGGFQFKSVPDGNYLVTVVYYGYPDLQVQASINNGVLTSIDLPMTKTV